MKKILMFMMFLILSLTSLAERFVVSSKDGYANLRKEATTNSKVIMKVDNSTQITLLFKNGDWYYVEIFKNNPLLYAEGYIHKSQLELHPETYVVFSKDGYANLRRGTTINSEILDVLDNGEYVTKLDEVGEWYRVEYAAFDGGYIHKSQLKKYKLRGACYEKNFDVYDVFNFILNKFSRKVCCVLKRWLCKS